MKYLLIITLSFLIAFPALAARSVEGTVPDLPPSQPMPEDTYVNISNNIEYKGAPEELNNQESEVNSSINKDQISPQTQGPLKNTRWFKWPLRTDEGGGGLLKNTLFLIFVVVVLGVGVYYFKRGK